MYQIWLKSLDIYSSYCQETKIWVRLRQKRNTDGCTMDGQTHRHPMSPKESAISLSLKKKHKKTDASLTGNIKREESNRSIKRMWEKFILSRRPVVSFWWKHVHKHWLTPLSTKPAKDKCSYVNCLCWGFTAHSIQWSQTEHGKIT